MTVTNPEPNTPAPGNDSELISIRALVLIGIAIAAGWLAATSAAWAIGLGTGFLVLLGTHQLVKR